MVRVQAGAASLVLEVFEEEARQRDRYRRASCPFPCKLATSDRVYKLSR